MKKHLVFFIILSAFILSCNKKEQTMSVDPNQVVLIFDKIPQPNDTLYYSENHFSVRNTPMPILSLQVIPLLSFNLPLPPPPQIPPVYKMKEDTLHFDVGKYSDYIIVTYRYAFNSSVKFFIKPDDCVSISHADSVPTINVVNRDAKPYDLSFDAHLIKNNKVLIPPTYMDMKQDETGEWVKNDVSDINIKIAHERKEILDSLKNKDLISDYAYNYWNKDAEFDIAASLIPKMSKEEMENRLMAFDEDSLRKNHNPYNVIYFQHLANKYYLHAIKLGNLWVYDYADAFDRMEEDGWIAGFTKRVLQYQWFQQLEKNSSIETSKKYYDKLIGDTRDTIFTSRLKKEYGNIFDQSLLSSKELELEDKEGKRLTFADILKHNEGKVVYVDFWASWCAPCLAEMPAATKVREQYADKDILFVYIGVYDKQEDWLKALSAAQLEDVKHSYLVVNDKTAPMLKELSIRSIPRYLLYNKKGKLSYKDAARPSAPNIETILDNLLK